MPAAQPRKKPRLSVAPSQAKRAAKGPSLADIEDVSVTDALEIRASLLDWYDKHHRVLPWRRNFQSKLVGGQAAGGAPLGLPQQQFMYWVWICEVMSQQTQVARAAEYFTRWIEKWPTVQELAAAKLDDVNELWAGLGYYRRARFLLEGAQYVVRDLRGAFPDNSLALQKIPGVGAYTGAAMASIAAGEKIAVVDANVVRVLARMRCLDWDPKNVKPYFALANALVDPDRPGDFNQAVMELGARVCTPNQTPACLECPVRANCHAFRRQQEGQSSASSAETSCAVTDWPPKAVKAQRREETAAVTILQLRSDATTEPSCLLVKRPENGLLAGLWEFPLRLVHPSNSRQADQEAMDAYLAETLGIRLGSPQIRVASRQHLGEAVHIFSHIKLLLRVERLLIQGSLEEDTESLEKRPQVRWVPSSRLAEEGLSSSVKKVWALAEKQRTKEVSSITKFFTKKTK